MLCKRVQVKEYHYSCTSPGSPVLDKLGGLSSASMLAIVTITFSTFLLSQKENIRSDALGDDYSL